MCNLSSFRSLPEAGAGRRLRRRVPASLLAAAFVLAACGGTEAADPDPADEAAAAADSDAASAADAEDAASNEGTASSVENCGLEIEPQQPPERIFAMNSGALENLLALGLEDRIIGAVGRTESLREDLRDTAEQVDIIHPGGADYPSPEAVLEMEPDFVYSVYPSAFREDGGIATREELHDLDIQTYLAPGRCPDRDEELPVEFEEIWTELRELGTLLDARDRAEEVVEEQQEAIEAVRAELPEVDDLEVLWWDMGQDDGPTAGACCGAPGMILRELGVHNAFEDLPGHWSGTSWEQVVERDPDVVVIADFGEDDIDDKLAFIEGDATLRELRAFREDAIVVLPFAQTTPGLQNVAGIETIGAFLAEHADDR